MTITALADKYIPKPENKKVYIKSGETRDIIKEVLDCFKDSRDQLKKFAPYLKGSTTLETCSNIWNFWKKHIRYQVDDEGVQWIKTPAAVWASKFCDCKSFSVAVAGTMYCLGITGKFRFTSYGTNTTIPTHVYVVAMDGNKEIIIDCVWTGFNSQKPYAKKWDYNMTNIFRVSGISDIQAYQPRYAIGELNADLNDPELTEGELALALTVQGLELEQKIMRKNGVFGIGSTGDDKYKILIEGHKAVLGCLYRERKGIKISPTEKLAIEQKILAQNPNIGFLKKIFKGIKKVAKGVAKGVKNAVKAVKKVVKTPARVAAQGALKDSGGFFLYIFINPQQIPIEKLPTAVRIKREKALEYKARVEKKLQMPWKNFDSIVRNSIMTTFGDTPENVLAKWMQQSGFKIGFLPGLATMASGILSKAGGALKALFGQFGEDLGNDLEQYTPSLEDWGIMPYKEADRTELSMTLRNGGGSYYGNPGGNYYNPDGSAPTRGGVDDGLNDTPAGKEGYDEKGREIWQTNLDENDDVTGYTSLATGRTVGADQRPFTGDNKNVILEPDPVIISKPKKSVAGNDNTGLLIGIAVVAALAMGKR